MPHKQKKPKALKMRKKPKASASIATKEKWIKDKKALETKNAKRLSDYYAYKKRGKMLSDQIAGL